ncbi:MAG: hypothetical protein Q7R47_05130 [Candidatus Diapherotrites archaeon]|nr:hypothetical protein [Candidatus Diapherotrites archaeon]
MQQSKSEGTDAKETAIRSIPIELPRLMRQASSLRARALLAPREFQSFFNHADTPHVIQVALIRFWAAELIHQAGVHTIGKTPAYNHAKVAVRAAIIRHLQEHPPLLQKFETIVSARSRKSIFGRARRAFSRRPTPRPRSR